MKSDCSFLHHTDIRPLYDPGFNKPRACLGYGVGLRTCHFPWLEQHLLPRDSGVDWFEAITENFLDHKGYARHFLFKLREHYPIALHGVSMSIGATDPLNTAYLKSLRQLCGDLQPALVSDHLCWTGVNGVNSHDLLPVPLTEESLKHVSERVNKVQDCLGRKLVLENPSTYMCFAGNDYAEWDFLNQLVSCTGCELLIDVNNIYVSSVNQGFNPQTYLDGLPLDSIVQCHLAGHTDCATHIIDTHDKPVHHKVWALYRDLIDRCGRNVSTLLEWDADIPDFPELVAELNLAKGVIRGDMPERADSLRPGANTDSVQLSTPLSAHLEKAPSMFLEQQ
ncbi:DUF692 domain-containing protein [Motilimonas sp. E26]|uniref:MNIO family bufferin maturase n=1 Tax=Motilimonas sp. E26 TaxID=2865674 RepID=UPI001E3DB7F0|nr:DUF692 domain-containing protein [Motilimonas sp. E26]MCE0557897.1 DUF692 domain-containing protein [Motilimonas sp. E26]